MAKMSATMTRLEIPTISYGKPIYLLKLTGVTDIGDQTSFTFPRAFKAAPDLLSSAVVCATPFASDNAPISGVSVLSTTAFVASVGGTIKTAAVDLTYMIQGELAS